MILKLCGMRDPENIRRALNLGIDWIGFIFYKKSPRQLTVDNGQLTTGIKDNCQLSTVNCQLKKVGVFVNAPIGEMTETASRYSLDYLQLHGNESPEVCCRLKAEGYKLIKAFSIASGEDIKQAEAYEGLADYFLFDTKCAGFGGSGKTFDWTVLSAYKGNTPFLLSGGINPGSVEAIKAFHHPAWAGIDLNSGFETQPGLKDINKLKNFIEKINN